MKNLLLLLFVLAAFAVNAQWVSQTSGVTVDLYSVSAVDTNVCWAVGGMATVLRTTNGGTTWTNVGVAPVSGDVYNVFAVSATTALVTTTPSTTSFVYRTTDAGATWTQVFSQSGGFIDNIWMTSASTGYLQGDPVGARWSLWKTTDGGATWDSTGLKLAQVGSEAGWNNAFYCEGANIWFGTNSSKVYYSSNSGAAWTAQATTGQVNSLSVFFSGAYGLTGGSSTVFRTVNSGTTWAALTAPGSGQAYCLTASGANWFMSRLARLYASTDNGATWVVSDTTSPNALYAIGKAKTGNAVWAVAGGGLIYKGKFPQVIPVELTSFNARAVNGTVALSWTTATETNNRGFEIQRSTDGSAFTAIGFVNGNGTTAEKSAYTFTDASVAGGNYSYRLKQVDFDGTASLSQAVEINIAVPVKAELMQNYPNPFNPTTSISFSIPADDHVSIIVYDVLGNQVAQAANGFYTAGIHTVTYNASSLNSGVYFYTMRAGNGFVQTAKMSLLK